ncbi:hypothetical protein [Microbispora siamensis]|uniref:Uncharacterized protein n=1 Tax=Microbispora siamensis TaxID=564413 RepID=A0ABQ4GUP2_9ACTN|nr:hypothetical protein [Microbispora siamensis]GIH65145.1 hypothetical protein Msi02_59620 [Microbispora siamensis]
MVSTFQSWGDRLLARLVPRTEASAAVPCWCPGYSQAGPNCPCNNGVRQVCCYGGNYGYYCYSQAC